LGTVLGGIGRRDGSSAGVSKSVSTGSRKGKVQAGSEPGLLI
jgi:hypothetical protein